MDLKENFINVVKNNYANFNGRARRKEYWSFVLVNFLIGLVFGLLGFITEAATYISSIISLALFLPGLAVSVRRLHDTGKSGWYLLIALIPIIGGLYLIYLMFKEGDQGQNQYGSDPKGIINDDPFAGQRELNNPFS